MHPIPLNLRTTSRYRGLSHEITPCLTKKSITTTLQLGLYIFIVLPVLVVVLVVVEVVVEVVVLVEVLVVELCTNNLITSSMSNNSKHPTSPSITCGVKDEGGGRGKSKTNKQSLLMLPTSSSPWYDTAPIYMHRERERES